MTTFVKSLILDKCRFIRQNKVVITCLSIYKSIVIMYFVCSILPYIYLDSYILCKFHKCFLTLVACMVFLPCNEPQTHFCYFSPHPIVWKCHFFSSWSHNHLSNSWLNFVHIFLSKKFSKSIYKTTKKPIVFPCENIAD